MSRLLPLLLLAALPLSAQATTVRPATRAELAARADQVVRARVVSQRAARSERSGRPLTVSALKALETYRGTLTGDFEIEQLGGALEGARTLVPGDARLEVGEEVVLFLRCTGKPRCRILGLGLGKYAVRRDAQGRTVAVRDAQGLRDRSGAPLQADVVPLETLARELRGAK
ncbi:MAG: hypothetical protein ACOX6T_12630 [Myxococcales bacterium]|jgi:hypothetical protein